MPSSRSVRETTWCRGRRGRSAAVALASLIVFPAAAKASQQPPHPADLDAMIIKEAQRHGIPERLVRRVVMRESRYNPRARNHKYWGLMQISYPTARSMGFRGTPEELLNPLTNLTYAVPYLANAFIAAGRHEDAAVRLYASGYYDTARRHGLLGLMRTAESSPIENVQEAAPASAPSSGIFGALFGTHEAAPALTQEPPPQLVATAAPPAPAPRPISGAPDATRAPSGGVPSGGAKSGGADVASNGSATTDTDMVLDKSGRLEPPKRWRRDGGTTVIARGEQGDTHQVASADPSDSRSRRHAGHHTRKVTEFAAAELPASAQAYAATTSETAPPQAAIEQAVSGSRQGEQQTAAAAPGEAPPPSGTSGEKAAATVARSETESVKAAHHRVARRHVAHHTAVAKATVPASSAASAKTLAELK